MHENDLTDAEKKSLNDFRAALRKEIESWSDLYNFLHARIDIFQRFPNQQTMMNSMYTHRAFVMALQDLPDEGDIQVIVDRMAFIMTHDHVRLGAKLMLLGDNPNINVIVIDKEALAELQRVPGEEAPGATTVPDPSKKILH